jgi:hypothetical protein
VLKIDYEKAYDRFNWDFLEEMMSSRGVGSKCVSWVMKLVNNGSIAIRLNDRNSGFFKPGKGLRQGNPLSPLLFNLLTDVFTRMLLKAAQGGPMYSLYLEGFIILQYVDDTLLFLKLDKVAMCHMKWLMVCYEHLSDMKINYRKSDMTPINMDEGEANGYAKIFCCKIGCFPFST